MDISIHAPTRGATTWTSASLTFSAFQSTLPREERLVALRLPPLRCLFQSTLPREERQKWAPKSGDTIEISIHAPTRGATKVTDFVNNLLSDFNPRSHERSDQSRLSCRHQRPDFNPRSHERSDAYRADNIGYWKISIHAPTRGATLS